MDSPRRVIPGTEANILSNKILAMRYQSECDHPYPHIPINGRKCLMMICCIKGRGHHRVSNQQYLLKAGDILIIPQNVDYQFCREKSKVCEEIIMIFCPSFFDAMTIIHPDIARSLALRREDNDYLCRLSDIGCENMIFAFKSLYNEYMSCNPGWEMVVYSTAACIMATVFRPKAIVNTPSTSGEKLLHMQIIPYIDEHFDYHLNLEEIADRFLISTSKLCKLFREHMGMSCYQYLLKRRLAVAQMYLLEGVVPKQVWTLCGFTDYASFYRHYKKAYNHSPSEFVKKCKQ